ncbi:hypothetical protein ABW19_dt0210336 [Dactylella cylindrospora]|nr:hypothetical protein ABW19_dt0210336 [Dactylella cylindrospora]
MKLKHKEIMMKLDYCSRVRIRLKIALSDSPFADGRNGKGLRSLVWDSTVFAGCLGAHLRTDHAGLLRAILEECALVIRVFHGTLIRCIFNVHCSKTLCGIHDETFRTCGSPSRAPSIGDSGHR